MDVFLTLAIYFLFLVCPITLGLLVRYKKITIRQMILVANTLLSFFFGFLGLYAALSDKASQTLSMLSLDDWVISIVVSVFLWLLLFLLTKPLLSK